MMKNSNKFLAIMLVFVISFCIIGCSDKTPKGMSAEMYNYVKETTTKVHSFLDGEIERSETKDLTEITNKMVELLEKENEEGLLDEKYYNDKEAATLTTTMLLYLYAEDSIDELEDTLAEIDKMLENK